MPIACPKGHTDIHKIGQVPTRRGSKQRFRCRRCGRTFYAEKRR